MRFGDVKLVTEAKLFVLETISCIFDQRLNHRLHLAFSFFDSKFDEMFLSGDQFDQCEEKYVTRLISQLFDANSIKKLFVTKHGKSEEPPEKVGCIGRLLGKEDKEDSVMLGSLMEHPDAPDAFVTSLLQLTAYDSMELKVKTLQVLMAHLGEKEQLVRMMGTACLTNHPGITPAIHALEMEVDHLRCSLKWLGLPPSKQRTEAVETCLKLFPKWQALCTPGSKVMMNGKQLEINEYVAGKMAEAFHVLGAHEHIARIWSLPEPGDLSGMQLRQIIQDADEDGNGEIDPEEFEELLNMLLELLLPETQEGPAEKFVIKFRQASTGAFAELDTNGSNMLEADELINLTNWLMQHLEDLQQDPGFRQISKQQMNVRRKEIMRGGMKLLGLMCDYNPATQKESASSLGYFMAHASEPDMEVAEFISKLVLDCNYVISRFDMRGIKGVTLIMGENHDAGWLKALRHLCAPEGLPNQKTVKNVIDNVKEYLRPLEAHLGDPNSVLASGNSSEIEWHCEFVLLLAILVDGGFTNNLRFVHDLVSLDQCIEQICLPPSKVLQMSEIIGPSGLMIDIKTDNKSESELPADILEKGDELLPAGDATC